METKVVTHARMLSLTWIIATAAAYRPSPVVTCCATQPLHFVFEGPHALQHQQLVK